jgi:hypothetical protein
VCVCVCVCVWVGGCVCVWLSRQTKIGVLPGTDTENK